MNRYQTDEKLVLVYTFSAPREMVFNAFADKDALNEWWGPVESSNTALSLDFRPGGIFHFKMDFGEQVAYGRFLFRQISPYTLLEFTNGFADEQARVVKAPFDVRLPLEILYRLVFTENNGTTTITLTAEPFNASREEAEGFRSINSSMQQGYGATFDKLGLYLAKKQTV